jgi:hypothetical protein
MNLKVKRITGGIFTEADRLEIVLDSEGNDMVQVLHKVEVVSGIDVTHGGGADAETWLHYKENQEEGFIDYSNVQMDVSQVAKGASVIKVQMEGFTISRWNDYLSDVETYNNQPYVGEEDSLEEPIVDDYKTTLETGSITLEWLDDEFV